MFEKPRFLYYLLFILLLYFFVIKSAALALLCEEYVCVISFRAAYIPNEINYRK